METTFTEVDRKLAVILELVEDLKAEVSRQTTNKSIHIIMEVVAKHTDYKPSLIRSDKVSKELMDLRVIIYMLARARGYTNDVIAKYLNRETSTVVPYTQRHITGVKTDQSYNTLYKILESGLIDRENKDNIY